MARQGTGQKRKGEPTLTAADWAEAALQMIAERGVPAVTVDALAERLGVTKGSFYWHFDGRRALLAAALQRWEARSTTETTAALDAVDDPHKRLQLILDASFQTPRSRSLYAALGAAADEPAVSAALQRVATRRIEYLEQCYAALGESDAGARALLAYAAYRGLLQIAREAPSALKRADAYAAVAREALLPNAPRRARSRGTSRP